jgi:hypothetical protein
MMRWRLLVLARAARRGGIWVGLRPPGPPASPRHCGNRAATRDADTAGVRDCAAGPKGPARSRKRERMAHPLGKGDSERGPSAENARAGGPGPLRCGATPCRTAWFPSVPEPVTVPVTDAVVSVRPEDPFSGRSPRQPSRAGGDRACRKHPFRVRSPRNRTDAAGRNQATGRDGLRKGGRVRTRQARPWRRGRAENRVPRRGRDDHRIGAPQFCLAGEGWFRIWNFFAPEGNFRS